jgi:hypothetical protein
MYMMSSSDLERVDVSFCELLDYLVALQAFQDLAFASMMRNYPKPKVLLSHASLLTL